MDEDGLSLLETTVRKRRLVVFRFDGEDWDRLQESRRGLNEFTIVKPHETFRNLRTPTVCLVICNNHFETELRLGVVSSRMGVSTLDSRVKVTRTERIQPSSEAELRQLVTGTFARAWRERLSSRETPIVLPPGLSASVIGSLAEIESNRFPMHRVAASLSSPERFGGAIELQQDAVRTALRTFGLSMDGRAASLELVEQRETALARINIVEDAVVEHDARFIPGYDLVGSDLTGRAMFKNERGQLVVYTANRRPLETVFGVDLIYLNEIRQNIVMLQYKMLERLSRKKKSDDWIYRPDGLLEAEIKRMGVFRKEQSPNQYEYRLNPQVFYLRFVKRDGALKNAAITIPIDHFEQLRKDPACRGPRGGFRISFESLAGRYLREGAFLDLIGSGYIGAHSETTKHLRELIQAVLRSDRAVVAAIQSSRDDTDVEAEELISNSLG